MRCRSAATSSPAPSSPAYLAPITEVAAYAGPDARVVWTLLDALSAIARCCGDPERERIALLARDQIRVAAVADARLEFECERLERDEPGDPIRPVPSR